MRREQYAVGDRPQVEVSVKSGDVHLLPGSPGEITVELVGSDAAVEAMEVTQSGDRVTVRDRSGRRGWRSKGVEVTISLPEGTRAALRAASGNVSGSVALAAASVELASGDLRLDDVAGDVDVEVASGDVFLAAVEGDVSISTASGDIRVGETGGRTVINSASGDVDLGRLSGSLKVETASGDVNVGAFGGSELNGQSMSGDFRIGLEPGLSVDADIQTLSGSIRNETTESGEASSRHVAVRIKTFSGDIVFRSSS
jgi:DUF4097 and DUF4098 domain-containing protein YvlB